MSMGNNDEILNKFKKENDENIKRAANMAKAAFGGKANKIDELMNDPKKLEMLTSKLSRKDMEKLSKLLENPDNITKLLKNDKVKENIDKFLEES